MHRHLQLNAWRIITNTTRATWLAAIAALLALPISIISLTYTIWSEQAESRENAHIRVTPEIADYPTELRDLGAAGTVSVFWSVLVANNSEQAVSLVAYNLWDIRDGDVKITYPSLDGGIYSTNLSPIKLPITIDAGHARKLFLKTGLLMDPEPYKVAMDRFGSGPVGSIRELTNYLYSQGTDFFGNAAALTRLPGGERVIIEGKRKEQVLLATFETARGTRISTIVSWYSTGSGG